MESSQEVKKLKQEYGRFFDDHPTYVVTDDVLTVQEHCLIRTVWCLPGRHNRSTVRSYSRPRGSRGWTIQ